MDTLSFESLYNQARLGFDLLSQAFTKPVSIFLLIGALFILWRLLAPHR